MCEACPNVKVVKEVSDNNLLLDDSGYIDSIASLL